MSKKGRPKICKKCILEAPGSSRDSAFGSCSTWFGTERINNWGQFGFKFYWNRWLKNVEKDTKIIQKCKKWSEIDGKSWEDRSNFGTCESLFFCKDAFVKTRFSPNGRSKNSFLKVRSKKTSESMLKKTKPKWCEKQLKEFKKDSNMQPKSFNKTM